MHFLTNFILIFFLFYLSLFVFISPTFAGQNKFITIVNPVRGNDFWQVSGQRPVDNLKKEWQLIGDKNLAVTWLVRPDAFEDSEVVSFFKNLPSNQEIGIFAEITPTWAKLAGVN